MHWFVGIILGVLTGYAIWPPEPNGQSALAIVLGLIILIKALAFRRRVGLVPGFWIGVVLGVFCGLIFSNLLIGVIVADIVFVSSLWLTKDAMPITDTPRSPTNRAPH